MSTPEPTEVMLNTDILEYLFKRILVEQKYWDYYMKSSGKAKEKKS